jgi:TPR repeat protein
MTKKCSKTLSRKDLKEKKAKKAVLQNDAAAEACYQEAIGTWNASVIPRETTRAIGLFQRAAELGHPDAMYEMGCILSNTPRVVAKAFGEGTPTDGQEYWEDDDFIEGMGWFGRAAEKGHPHAMYKAAVGLERGMGIAPNPALALDYLKRSAALGAPESWSWLGIKYHKGEGVERDAEAGLRLIRRAVGADITEAMSYYARCLLEGEGVGTDPQEARRLFEIAAGRGDMTSMKFMGIIYENGMGVEPDPHLAHEWYQRAVASPLCDTHSLYLLATSFSLGPEGVRDEEMAYHYMDAAAIEGDAKALCALGAMHYYGKGVERDRHRALWLFRIAGDEGGPRLREAVTSFLEGEGLSLT